MKKIILFCGLSLIALALTAQQGRVIPELVRPTGLVVDEARIYVTEDATVSIFDLKTLKLIAKFGRAGEGPQEFNVIPGQLPLGIDSRPDELLISSLGKLSRWTKDGKFISEFQYLPTNAFMPQALKNGRFIGMGNRQEDQKIFRTVVICDDKMNRVKEIYADELNFQPGKGLVALSQVFQFARDDDFIILPGKKDNELEVFDLELKLLRTISVPEDKRSVDKAFRDDFMSEMERNPATRDYIEMLKPIRYPDTYPAISFFYAEKGRLYVFTWKRDGDNWEYFSFNLADGRRLSQAKAPLLRQSTIQPYPLALFGNRLFQLVENEDDDWMLISTEMK